MKKILQIHPALIAIIILSSACSSLLPSTTPTPPATLSPTPTPKPAQPVTSNNLNQLKIAGQLGDGQLNRFSIHPNLPLIAVGGSRGIWLLDSESLTITGYFDAHLGEVRSLDFSPDGALLVSGGKDGLVKVWEAESWTLLGVLRGHKAPINQIVFSPDSHLLASTSEDGDVIVWDAIEQTKVTLFEHHVIDTEALAWSPDGTRIASGDLQGDIFIWEADNGETINHLTNHEGWVTDLLWLANGSLVSSSFDRTIRVWGADGGLALATYTHFTIVNALAYSAKRDALISGGGGPFHLREWQLASGTMLREIKGLTSWVNQIEWLADGEHYLTLSSDSRLALWDGRFGQIVAEFDPPDSSFGSQGNSIAISPDGTKLVTGEGSGKLLIWDTKDKSLASILSHHMLGISGLAYSRDGRLLAAASGDGKISIWRMPEGEFIRELAGFSGMINAISWSPDGRRLASGTTFGQIQTWNVTTGQQEQTIFPDLEVESVAWSPNGAHIVSGNIAGELQVWALADNSIVFESDKHVGLLTTLLWSPDGDHLLSLDRNGRGYIWDGDDFHITATLENGGRLSEAAAWSPDSSMIAIGSTDGLITLFDAASGDALEALSGMPDSVRALVWLPDSSALVALGLDGVATIWQVAERSTTSVFMPDLSTPAPHEFAAGSKPLTHDTISNLGLISQLGAGSREDHALQPNGKLLAVATGTGVWLFDHPGGTKQGFLPGDAASFVAWSPDGRWLAVREPFQVVIWDLAAGQITQTYPTAYNPSGQLLWAPEDGLLAAATTNGTIQVWNTSSGEPARELRHDYPDADISGVVWLDAMHIAGAIEYETESTIKSAILIWDLVSGKAKTELRGPAGEITALAFDPESGQLVAGDSKGTVWDWLTNPWALFAKELVRNNHSITALSIANDTVWIGDETGTVSEWNINGGLNSARSAEGFPITDFLYTGNGTFEAMNIHEPLAGADLRGALTTSAISPDGKSLAVVGDDGLLDIWELTGGQRIARLSEAATALLDIAWSTGGSGLIAMGDDGLLHIWQGANFEHLSFGEHAEVEGKREPIHTALGVSPDGAEIAYGDALGNIVVVDAARLSLDHYLLPSETQGAEQPQIVDLAYAPDGVLLAALDEHGTLTLWDVETRILFQQLELFEVTGYRLAWSPGGNFLAISGSDGLFEVERVILWDNETSQVQREIPLAWASNVRGLAWSPDGVVLALGFADAFTGKGTLSFYDVETDSLLNDRWEAHNLPIYDLTWLADGFALLSTSEDGVVRLWGIP
jgi:WD40 repeat protein